jgi:hypothetical protein
VAATAATLVAWRVYRRQRDDDAPVINCELRRTSPNGWVALSVIVKNITDTRWRCEKFEIRRPRTGRGISRWDAPSTNGRYGQEVDWPAAEAVAARTFAGTAQVAPAGTPRHPHLGGGDVSREDIFLLRSSIPSNKVSIRLTLASMEAIERRITIIIKRQLPAEPATAID